jgi:DNA helicase-4
MPSIRSEYSNFMDLVFTFLSLYKSNHIDIKELNNRNNTIFTNKKRFLRAWIFIKIFERILKLYENNLKDLNVIDFDDMINYSTTYINNDKIKTPYQYIIVDEFQDIWIGRYKLIKSIIEKNKAELFCVWDDWQSIYRFTWWDLNIFTHFEEYFPFWEQLFINKTYRYHQKVNDVTHQFITKNKAQINKILESWNKEKAEEPIFNIINYKDDNHKKELLNMVLKKYKTNIVALWRYTSEKKLVPKGIDFMTIHRSKWLEADYIVLLNWNNWSYWFPSKKKDNRLLDLVLSEPDNFKYSEERRLFYVALTRSKKKTFILTKEWNKSYFIKELEEILWTKSLDIEENKNMCPRCKKWDLIPRENFAKWALWCNNYPQCDYTIRTISPIKRHKWLPLSKLDNKWLNWILDKFANDKIMQYSVYYELERRKNNR